MTAFQWLVAGFAAAGNGILTALARRRQSLGEPGFPTWAVCNQFRRERAMCRCWIRWMTGPAAFMITTIK